MYLFKRFFIAVIIQLLFMISLSGQKYQNGTRLLKGAEVLSATPLQLDYVLENLSDTANITTNIHEGKTHLILNDGSGLWREWWYYMGKWQLKTADGRLPAGKDGSIQTKSGKNFAGTLLGINEGFIRSLDDIPSDVGINNGTATVRVTPNSMAVMEATKTSPKGNITSNIFVSANETEQNVTWINKSPYKGARLKMDTATLEHWQTTLTNDFWNFKSSLADTTFYLKKRLKFEQPNTYLYTNNGDLHLKDASGDYSLAELAKDSAGELITNNSSTITFSGFGTTTSPLSASVNPIPGINNAILYRNTTGQPAASGFVTLDDKNRLSSSSDFTIIAPSNKITVASGNVPANAQLILNTATGSTNLESNTSSFSQGISLQPNYINIQCTDRNNSLISNMFLTSAGAFMNVESEISLARIIKSDRRRTEINVTNGTSDINGVKLQDGLENPPSDNVLSGAYVRANKNLGVKLGFQGNTGEPSAYINITKAGNITLSDQGGTIDIKNVTQLATGIKPVVLLSVAPATINIDFDNMARSNIFRMNAPLNGNKTIDVINISIPANSLKEFEIWIPQPATLRTVTWFSGITWVEGGIPVMEANKTNVFVFRTIDGLNYHGRLYYSF